MPGPAASAHCTATSRTGLPAPSLAAAISRTTSPVRTVVAAGSSASRVTEFTTTWRGNAAVAVPAAAVIVARPGATARRSPSGVIVATRGLLDVKLTGSWRTSSCLEYAVPTSVRCVPVTSLPGSGAMATRVADSVGTVNTAKPNAWPWVPGTTATAVTRTTPAYPAVTTPVESTCP